MTHLLRRSACVLLLLAGSAAQAQIDSPVGPASDIAFGARAGLTDWDRISQVHVGLHVKLGEILPNVRVTPNLEAGFGDDLTLIALNGDVMYDFTEFFSHPWNLYGGASLAGNYLAPEGFDSDFDIGFAALVGLERTLANGHQGLVEVRLGLVDSPDVKLTFGYTLD